MQWYKFSITNDDVVANKVDIIQEDFRKIASAANVPDGFAIFCKNIYGGGLEIYLVTPTGYEQYSKEFIALYPLQPSEPIVDDESVVLLAGRWSAWRFVK